MRTLYHASAHDWGTVKVGDTVVLKPGTQNAQGVGVYFSAGEPDIRASDSVHEKGLTALFKVDMLGESSYRKHWYVSKGSRDRKKGRPQTWHSEGKRVILTVTKIEGSTIECLGELEGNKMIDLTIKEQNEIIDSLQLNESVFLTALASAEKRGISTEEFISELETRHTKAMKGYDDADQYEDGWRNNNGD